jgi:hypothetical protein
MRKSLPSAKQEVNLINKSKIKGTEKHKQLKIKIQKQK